MAIFWGTRRGSTKEEKDAIEALERRQESLESGFRLLKTEWIDVHDRLNRVMGRLNARIRKSEAVEGPESDAEAGPKGVDTPMLHAGTHAVLEQMRRRR